MSHSGKTSEPVPIPGGDLPRECGLGPVYEIADLPAPPPFSLRNLFHVIGPGAILLATAIGGGEWLVGPAQAVQHSLALFWVATAAIVLQLAFNLEAIRYTLYTGEPIYGGILRLWPGPKFWGPFYVVLAFLQLCWPALALSCANTLFSVFVGRTPDEASSGDELTGKLIALGLIVGVLILLHFGGTVERMLETASWFMLAFIFVFLITVNVVFIPWETWKTTLAGFFGLGKGGEGNIDWNLLGALAATAGTGGIGNLTITNWMRDKGFGMGALTGAIGSAVGSKEVKLSPGGKVFPATPSNLTRWREWMRYVTVDQIWVWALFCFLGMYLNVNLAVGIIPHGTSLSGLGTGAYQAQYMAEKLWSGFWFLTLLNGFWILFSTQLGNTDILARTITDVSWLSSAKVRGWRGGDVRGVYYTALFVVSAWAIATLWLGRALSMFTILANMAGAVLALAAFQVLIVNRRFLPRALRPPLWREAFLVACGLFYTFFSAQWIWSTLLRPLYGRLFGA